MSPSSSPAASIISTRSSPRTRERHPSRSSHRSSGCSSLDQFTGAGSQQVLLGEAQRIISAQLTSNILGSFSTALAQTLNVEDVSLGFDQHSNLVVEVRKYVTPTVSVLYRSTTTAPVTQAYGVSYLLRDTASLDFLSTVASQGFVTYLMDMRFTFK